MSLDRSVQHSMNASFGKGCGTWTVEGGHPDENEGLGVEEQTTNETGRDLVLKIKA